MANGKLVYNKEGLIQFDFDLMNSKGQRLDRVVVCSGAPSAQVLLPAEKDFSGSMRPIPEGNWKNWQGGVQSKWLGRGIGTVLDILNPNQPETQPICHWNSSGCQLQN